MADWILIGDGNLSNEEDDEITISTPYDISDLVIALSSSDEMDKSCTESEYSSDEADAEEEEEGDYLPDEDSNYSEIGDDVFDIAPPVMSHKLERINRIAHLVLPRLPAKTLLRFKSVSPNFKNLISSPFMVLSHILHPKLVSGLFYDNGDSFGYVSFDPPLSNLPDASLSYLPEPSNIMASTLGVMCLRGLQTLKYYMTNPTTKQWAELPQPNMLHPDDVSVVVVFDEPSVYNFSGDYRVVCAYPVIEGVWTFETFSSGTWAWTQSSEICAVENILSESGTAVGAMAYWRTTMETVLSYNPVKDRTNIIPRPHSEMAEVWWELGEMDGKLSVTSKLHEKMILVSTLESANNEEMLHWEKVGSFWLSNDHGDPRPIQSQGSAALVFWEEKKFLRELVLRDVQGKVLRKFDYPNNYHDFVPYISTLVPVKRSDAGTSTEPSVNNNDELSQEASET
ncbi:F-box protein [Rhynchospora pubera]|uniref:F-box protein n=1 Tax=Rhynchospora pubera TaxID=906938 RepID=A0AAV8GKB3_9POAL|nr:F-box protein [Rhynchospora pubera]